MDVRVSEEYHEPAYQTHIASSRVSKRDARVGMKGARPKPSTGPRQGKWNGCVLTPVLYWHSHVHYSVGVHVNCDTMNTCKQINNPTHNRVMQTGASHRDRQTERKTHTHTHTHTQRERERENPRVVEAHQRPVKTGVCFLLNASSAMSLSSLLSTLS